MGLCAKSAGLCKVLPTVLNRGFDSRKDQLVSKLLFVFISFLLNNIGIDYFFNLLVIHFNQNLIGTIEIVPFWHILNLYFTLVSFVDDQIVLEY